MPLKLGISWAHSSEPPEMLLGNISAILPAVEDALIGQLICSSTRGACRTPGVVYHDLTRHLWSSSPLMETNLSSKQGSSFKGHSGRQLCDICGGVGMLVVHPLKEHGAQTHCAKCSATKVPQRCSRWLGPERQPRFRVDKRFMHDHELCCRRTSQVPSVDLTLRHKLETEP